MINTMLPSHIVGQVLANPGRIRVEHEDILIWLGTSSGEFSLDQLTNFGWGGMMCRTRLMLSYRGYQRRQRSSCSSLVWQDRLLTNVARNIQETEACRLCGCVGEDVIHILWGCRAAQVGFVVVCERMLFIFFGIVERLKSCGGVFLDDETA